MSAKRSSSGGTVSPSVDSPVKRSLGPAAALVWAPETSRGRVRVRAGGKLLRSSPADVHEPEAAAAAAHASEAEDEDVAAAAAVEEECELRGGGGGSEELLEAPVVDADVGAGAGAAGRPLRCSSIRFDCTSSG